jgi:2-oxoglutarate dehydrogenase E1 component (EC 1.2.4.2)
MLGNSYLFGANAPFIEELYESYLENPASVTDVWRDYFDRLQNLPGAGVGAGRDVAHAPVVASFAQRAKLGTLRAAPTGAAADKKQVAVLQLINAYRFLGNRWAQLDPLKRSERPAIPELDPAHYGFTEGGIL